MPLVDTVRRASALLLLLATIAASHLAAGAQSSSAWIGGETFQLELALGPEERARGLMFRDRIRRDGGMLFVFPASRPRSFWMKNCLVDMDILFLDDEGTVTTIHEMSAEPLQRRGESMADYHTRLPRYPSDGPARFAVELKRGTAARLGISVGQRVGLDIENLTQRAY